MAPTCYSARKFNLSHLGVLFFFNSFMGLKKNMELLWHQRTRVNFLTLPYDYNF